MARRTSPSNQKTMANDTLEASKQNMLADIDRRVADHILEPANAALLKKLILKADDIDEAYKIESLGTTYKRTGFHFDKCLENTDKVIHYFRKNEALSFRTDDSKLVHKLIIGDNYDALQNLLIQYRGRVSVIYIDPPYGKDSMGEFAKTNYENAISRDNLLSMLFPRLMLAKQLLSDDGVIFCSIDDRNQAYVKCMMDDIFNEFGFVTSFVWQKKKGGGLPKFVYEGHEYVLCYLRNKAIMKKLLVNDESGVTEKDIIEKDGRLYRINDDFIRASFGKYKAGEERRCHYEDLLECKGKEKWDEVNEKLKTGEYILRQSKSDPTKHYVCRLDDITEGKKKVVYSIISGIRTEDGNTQIEDLGLQFDSPKPIELISLLVNLTQKKDAIVLDFFAGSGTTGHAVLALNENDKGTRQFILCQMNEKTDNTPNGIPYDVTTKRLKRIMTGECYDGSRNFKWTQDNPPYGGNLDVYEIAEVTDDNAEEGKTPFDVIDETLYGQEPFATFREKVAWVCGNFAHTQKYLENDDEWEKRKRKNDHATGE